MFEAKRSERGTLQYLPSLYDAGLAFHAISRTRYTISTVN